MGAQVGQLAAALAVAVDVLVDDVRVDDGPGGERGQAVAAGLAVQDGEVEPGVHRDDRDARGDDLAERGEDVGDDLGGRLALGAGPRGADAVDLLRLGGDVDAGVGEPRCGVGGLAAAALDDAGGDDAVLLDVDAGGLEVEASHTAEVPGHEAPPARSV